jgi:hypothetical protein
MTTKGAYATGRAFRQALEMRLKQMAAEAGEDIQRLRRQVAFDRLLARVFAGGGRAWTLKGGYAMELWLRFAGIAPPRFRILSKEQQFAEKLHAYTMTNRPAPNSRVKDLVDLALLVTRLPLDPELLRKALDQTFSQRDSHPLPADLAAPAAAWDAPFAALAAETNLGLTIAGAFELVRTFFRKLEARREHDS